MRLKMLLFFFLAIFFNAFSQTINEDVVYLNNGSLYRGKIIDSTQVSTVKIECYDHNVFVINRSEIKKLTKEAIDVNQRFIDSQGIAIQQNLPELNYFKKRIRFNASVNYGVNINGDFNRLNTFSFKVEALYNLSKRVGLGIQTGFNTISNSNSELLLPLSDPTDSYNPFGLSKDNIGKRFLGRMSLPVCLSYDQLLFAAKINTILHLSLGYDINLTKPISSFTEYNNNGYYQTYKRDFYWRNGIVINPEIRFVTQLYKKFVFMPAIGFIKNNIQYRFVEEEYRSSIWSNNPQSNKDESSGNFNYNFLYLKLAIGF
jgi:hypothetical protein